MGINKTTILELPKKVMDFLSYNLMIISLILIGIIIVLVIIRFYRNKSDKNQDILEIGFEKE